MSYLTLSLTTGVDTGAAFTGTAGNDTYSATGKTFTNLDSINGGEGNDTLNIVDDSDSMSVAPSTTLTSIETVNIATSGDLGVVAGSTTVAAKAEVASVQFTDLAAGQTLTLAGITFTAGTSGATAAQVAAAFIDPAGAEAETNNSDVASENELLVVGGKLTGATFADNVTVVAADTAITAVMTTAGWVVTSGADATKATFTSNATSNYNVSNLLASGTAVTGQKQITTFAITTNGDGTNANNVMTITYNGVTFTSAANGNAAAVATSVAAAINAYVGTTVADATTTAGSVIVTTPTTASITMSKSAGTDTFSAAPTATQALITASAPTITTVDGTNAVTTTTATAAAYDLSANAVNTLNITQADSANLKAATASDVNISGVTGAIKVDGGKNLTVTDATADKAITIGADTVNAGTITVTDTNVGAAAIAVDGGTDVTVNMTGATATGSLTIGQGGAATDLPTGAVKVTSATAADVDATGSMHAITVTGGSTVEVTQTASSTKAGSNTAAWTASTITQGAVNITAGTATTSVTVNQTKSTAAVDAVKAVTGVTESASVKFGALKSGQSIIIGGNDDTTLDAGELKFTAAKDLTAAEVATAFANLSGSDTQAIGTVTNGTYSFASGTSAFTAWSSGAANGDTVVFSSTAAGPQTDFALKLLPAGTETVVQPTVTPTNGVAAVDAKTGVLGVANGAVVINDNATAASITTVSVDGYAGSSSIGSTTNTLSKLATLSLANSGSTGTAGETDAGMTVDAAGVATLGLTINNINGGVSLDGAGDSALKTLNITTTGADSSFALTAAAVETMTITGDKKATLSSGTFTALKSLTVTGSASAVFDSDEADTLESVTTTGTTGAVTVGINGAKATYTGGAGVDTVTLNTGTSLTKAINLGAGDDTLNFGSLTVTASSAALSGGDGTDTLVMGMTAAETLDDTAQTHYTSFERLTLSSAAGDASADTTVEIVTLNLANLGFTSYVTTMGSDEDTLKLDNMANNATLVLTAKGLMSAVIKDADTGTDDVLNIIAQTNETSTAVDGANDASADLGTVTAANIETVNLTFNDSNLDDDGDKTADESGERDVGVLVLAADTAATVTVTGNTSATLDLSGAVKATLVDASTLTGGLTLVADGATAGTEVKGGMGNDVLTSSGESDVLRGNDGKDTFTVTDLAQVYGGAGADVFNFNASTNLTKVSSVMDTLNTGDTFKLYYDADGTGTGTTLTAVDKFYASGAIYDADTTTDVAGKVNAALVQTAEGEASWFNHLGNTYIVIDGDEGTSTIASGASDTYVAGVDTVIKLVGTYNLGTGASFNVTTGTLEII